MSLFSVCLSFCLSVCLSVYLSVYMSVWLSVCLSVCLSICLAVYLPVCLCSVCVSVCLSACLSFCLSVCLLTCLSVFLFVLLSLYRETIDERGKMLTGKKNPKWKIKTTSVLRGISGTVKHMIMRLWFFVHFCNMVISASIFSIFSKCFFFVLLRG